MQKTPEERRKKINCFTDYQNKRLRNQHGVQHATETFKGRISRELSKESTDNLPSSCLLIALHIIHSIHFVSYTICFHVKSCHERF